MRIGISFRQRCASLASVAAAAVVWTAVAAPATNAAAAEAPCAPTALPTLDVPNGSIMWINDSGLAVGGVYDDQDTWAAYWTPRGSGYDAHRLPNDPLVDDEILDVNQHDRMIDYGFDPATGVAASYVYDLPTDTWWLLPGFGGANTRARRINDLGEVSGGSATSGGVTEPALWQPPYSHVTKLPRVGFGSYANGLNDAGTAVGYSVSGEYTPAFDPSVIDNAQPYHGFAFLTNPVQWQASNGKPTQLAVLHSQAALFAINDAGTIVGGADVDTDTTDAAWWRAGVVHDMGGRPGQYTMARGLSHGGWAVGDSESDAGGQAFIWTGQGSLQYLTGLVPGADSNAHGVDDVLRQAGGDSTSAAGATVPTIWQCPVGFTTG